MTNAPVSILRDDSLAAAHALMQLHDVRHLPVVDEQGLLVGVLSARELQVLARLDGFDMTRVAAGHVAAHEVFSVPPDSPVEDVCLQMADHKYGCAVVVRDRKVLGIFTTIDACKALADLLGHQRSS